jgi:hypothetical protein
LLLLRLSHNHLWRVSVLCLLLLEGGLLLLVLLEVSLLFEALAVVLSVLVFDEGEARAAEEHIVEETHIV